MGLGLAVDGIRFMHAFSHSPITNTSHITILTGLLPGVHGVTDFGVPLSPQHATWAELLKKQTYHTAAFIGHSYSFHIFPLCYSVVR
jgi:arylsulfatase A-like enzyme